MSEAKDKYQKLFLEEAQEHLQTLNDALLKFEKKPDPALAQEMMRAAHTLKGMAASMGYKEIEELAHRTEDKFENLGKGEEKATPEMIEAVFKNFDQLEKLVKEKSEADLSAEVSAEAEGVALAEKPEAFAPITSVKVEVEKLDALMNLMEELLVNRMRLGQIEARKNWSDLPGALGSLDRVISDLQYSIMQTRLVPVEQIFNRFPRMVRDLAKKQNKKVDFQISGGEIELDRSLINQIGEPLVHLLRNAVDHGIEKEGTISLSARREKGVAIIEVVNDGRPIDWKKISAKGRLASGQDKKDLLFSGISTKKGVSKVSGRGVGLTVVKAKVEEVGGKVDVESPVVATGKGLPAEASAKAGAKFTLELPLTLAIAQALLVKAGREKFAMPVADVDRLVRLKRDQIKKTADMEAAVIADEDVPLVRLADLFSNVVANPDNKETILTVLAKIREQTVGFIVDEVLSEQDIIIKPLTGLLKEQKGLSGATILGDGSVVLILDVAGLIEIKNQ